MKKFIRLRFQVRFFFTNVWRAMKWNSWIYPHPQGFLLVAFLNFLYFNLANVFMEVHNIVGKLVDSKIMNPPAQHGRRSLVWFFGVRISAVYHKLYLSLRRIKESTPKTVTVFETNIFCIDCRCVEENCRFGTVANNGYGYSNALTLIGRDS